MHDGSGKFVSINAFKGVEFGLGFEMIFGSQVMEILWSKENGYTSVPII